MENTDKNCVQYITNVHAKITLQKKITICCSINFSWPFRFQTKEKEYVETPRRLAVIRIIELTVS